MYIERNSETLTTHSLYNFLQNSMRDYVPRLISESFLSKYNDYLCTDYLAIDFKKENLDSTYQAITLLLTNELCFILDSNHYSRLFFAPEKNILILCEKYDDKIQLFLTYFFSLKERIEKIFLEVKKLEEFEPPAKPVNYIYSFSRRTGFSPEIRVLGEINVPFVGENYSEEIESEYEFITNKLTAKNPKGRLLILDGLPGTGKSYFIRNLVTSGAQKATFILLDYESAASVSGSELLNVLLNFKLKRTNPLIFIIEDADHFLHSRNENNMSVISSLLNMTDGILGEALDIRIIASTNIPLQNIEAALTRSGRLIQQLKFDLLMPSRASQLYYKLTGEKMEFEQALPVCEVYAKIK